MKSFSIGTDFSSISLCSITSFSFSFGISSTLGSCSSFWGICSCIGSLIGDFSCISLGLSFWAITLFLMTLVSGCFSLGLISSINSIGTSSSISCFFPSFIIITLFNTFSFGSFPYFIFLTNNSSPGISSWYSWSLPSFVIVLLLTILDWSVLDGPHFTVLYTTFLPGSSSTSSSFPSFIIITFLIILVVGFSFSSYFVGSNIISSLGAGSSFSFSLPNLTVLVFLMTFDRGNLFVPTLTTL